MTMKLVLRILATPVWGALALIVAVVSFVVSSAGFVLWIISGLVCVACVVLLFTHHTAGGIAFIVIAFLLSPYGIPALLRKLVCLLDGARAALKRFIMGR